MKKILALVLAVMLVVGMTPVTFAATLTDTTPAVLGYSATNSAADVMSIASTNVVGTVYPTGGKIKLYMFNPDGTNVSKSQIDKDKITLQTQIGSGGKAIKGIAIKNESYTPAGGTTNSGNRAYVQIEFQDVYVATGDLDFKVSFYLLYDKKRAGGTDDKYNFEGTMKNADQKVYADTDFLYTFDTPVMDVQEYVKSVKIDTGNDLIVNAKLFAGKKYYARTTVKVKSEDDAVLTQYPEIDTIYYLDTVNMSGSGNTIKIDIGDKLYVYNKDLEYIGTTADNLPFSTKYYVSSKELDVEDVNDIEGPTGPAEAVNPPMGGDDVVRNVNDNPGTGR